jgi:phospholipase/carboxylesterase
MRAERITRRELIRQAATALSASLLARVASACAGPVPERMALGVPSPSRSILAAGLSPLGIGGERDGVIFMPASIGEAPAPLLVMLHGAGGTGRRVSALVTPQAEEAGCVVLAPDARGTTWDAILGGFGPDVGFLGQALGATLARVAVDRSRIALGGFSDGATYALALGRANGDVFRALLAFSPGFLFDVRRTALPRCFVAHGRQDEILPIDRCSRVIVPALRNAGYDVRYREFDGPHAVPPPIAREGMTWFTGTS